MPVLPSGFGLPPLPYLVAILVGVVGVGGLLWRARPAITERAVLALAPWMVVGATLHALYQVGAPPAVRPLLGAPAVYLTTFVLAGAAWLLADAVLSGPRVERALAGAGVVVLLLAVGAVLPGHALRPAWPLAGLAVSVALAAGTWIGLRRIAPASTGTVRWAGVLVVFAHALDGASTAIGVDVLGFGERTPASRLIIEFAATLPTADLVGAGWLFVLVKLAVAALVVHLFADYVREEPTQAYLLLAAIAAVGLGPGAQNLLLYAVS